MPGTKLYVGNIAESHNSDELRQLFDKYGNVVEFDILKDFGFVHFETETEAKSAVDALDGVNHRGQSLKVEMSRSQVRQRPGMGGKGECYRCGGDGHWSKECPKGPTRGRGRGGRDGRDNRDRGEGFRRGGGFSAPYFSDPYDYYPRRPPPPHPYERLRYDPYERRVPPSLSPRDYYGYSRDAPDYYRRSPPRDPYYDYYLKRRYEALDRFGDAPERQSGPSQAVKEELKPPLIRTPMSARIPGRVPGPY